MQLPTPLRGSQDSTFPQKSGQDRACPPAEISTSSRVHIDRAASRVPNKGEDVTRSPTTRNCSEWKASVRALKRYQSAVSSSVRPTLDQQLLKNVCYPTRRSSHVSNRAVSLAVLMPRIRGAPLISRVIPAELNSRGGRDARNATLASTTGVLVSRRRRRSRERRPSDCPRQHGHMRPARCRRRRSTWSVAESRLPALRHARFGGDLRVSVAFPTASLLP
ncbi:hypothetical protein BV20DRAFT_811749 [Pilatotrama ljubarskyi]|nr:hypothetical protein BV20DRAFT_811749 [Pilatotrama ljubarskyi]